MRPVLARPQHRWAAWLATAWLIMVCGAVAFGGGTEPVAAGYSAQVTGAAIVAAQVVPAGGTPTAAAAGREMTVTWTATVLTGGTLAAGYVVRRYDSGGAESAVGNGCSGVIATLSCVEHDVPFGVWRYTITPHIATWTGEQGLPSAAAVTSTATLSLTNPTLTSLPAVVDGTVTGFVNGESLSFHLDGITGPLLAGAPASVPPGGSAAVTVTVPAGVDDSAHSIFAVGDQGTVASAAITVVDPPLLTSLVMDDANSNGKIDRVRVGFSKPLAAYNAGTTPWTLVNVPSNGSLTSVTVAGNVATLQLAEGPAAADTAVGSFTVALAASAAGVRDSAGQPASFSAAAPTDAAAPVAVVRQMVDLNGNGKVDSVALTFSEQLATSTTGTAGWSLAGVPSNGTLTAVTVSATTVSLAIAEGAGAPDTAVGSFTIGLTATVGGIADGAGNMSSFASVAPADRAAPVRTSMMVRDVNGNGKVDQVTAVFSEALSPYAAGTVPWTLSAIPSAGSLKTVTGSGSTVTLALNEGAGAATTAVGSFTVALAPNPSGVADPAGNRSSFTASTPADGALPVLTVLSMLDATGNGKIDQITAVFTETLGAYTAGTGPWTATGIPSAGSLTSVVATANTVTLTISEGPGAADTTVGSLLVALTQTTGGVQDTAGNLAGFAATPPLDKAKPARVAMVMNDVNVNGKVDQVALTFSEPLATYTAGTVPWALASAPSGGSLASVAATGSAVTLTLNEGTGAPSTALGSFKVTLAANATGIRDAAANQASFASIAPTDGARPLLTVLNMLDATGNGKVDQITAVFTETLGSYTAGTSPWTLAGVPSSGSLVSVAVATTTATLTISEGAGPADTTVGALTTGLTATAGGVQDPSGNVASFPTTRPLDKAKPARLSMVVNDVNANGKIDQVALTFSEPLSAYTAGNTPWTLASAPSSATLASVTAAGASTTMTLNEGAAAATTAVGSFKITLASSATGIRDAAANLAAFSSIAPTDGAAPLLTTLTTTDANLNGKIDRVTAVFTETLTTYTAGTAPWTLTNVPSTGTLASVAVATTTAALTITEGAGAADTTVGSFTVTLGANGAGVRDPAGNQAAFATTAPADKAAPARVTMAMNDLNSNARVDQVTVTFSEPLTPYTAANTPWTLAAGPSGATLTSVAVSASAATLTLAEGAGAASTAVGTFTIALAANSAGIADAAGNQTSWAAVAPSDRATPVLLASNMNDITANGKVDQVTFVFSEALAAYTAGTTPWALNNTPSAGALSTVTVSTTTATLTITEGSGAADTAVGAFTVAMSSNTLGVRDAAGNLAVMPATAPADRAKPIRLTMGMYDTTGNGKVDQLALTFSEPLQPYNAATTAVTLFAAPSGATVASVSTTGAAATINLAEGAGAANTAVGSFTVALAADAAGIRDATANLSSWTAVAPADKAAPALVTMTISDPNTNGRIERVTATFSEPLSTYTAGVTPWTLTGVPSGGSLASVYVLTTTATLTLTEGAGPIDTSVGTFTIALAANAAGIGDAAANPATFAATAPADAARPVATSVTTTGGANIGKIEPGDTLIVVFSEAIAAGSLPATTTVTEADPVGAGNDTLTVDGITSGARSTGSDNYITLDGGTASFASSPVSLTNATITITVGPTCTGSGCASIVQSNVSSSLTFAPGASVTDVFANPASSTRSDYIRLY